MPGSIVREVIVRGNFLMDGYQKYLSKHLLGRLAQ
jgi:hypothetical protein